MSFATLDSLKGLLGIPPGTTTKFEAALQLAVDAANAEILQYLCLDPDATVRTYSVEAIAHRRDDRIQAIRIGPRPVVSIANVVLLGKDLTEGVDFELEKNVVKLCDPCVCPSWYWVARARTGPGNECNFFTADVDAGYATIPPNLTMGAAQLALFYYQGGPGRGLKRKKIRNYEVEFDHSTQALGVGGHWPPMLTAALGANVRVLKMITANPT